MQDLSSQGLDAPCAPGAETDMWLHLSLSTHHSWKEEICQVQGQDTNHLQEVQRASVSGSVKKIFHYWQEPSRLS